MLLYSVRRICELFQQVQLAYSAKFISKPVYGICLSEVFKSYVKFMQTFLVRC